MPCLPLATRGMISATSRGARVQASSASTVSKRPTSSRVFWVGVISFSSWARASASAARSQSCSTISVPSNAATCAAGAAAMKKRVSKRLGRASGVSQWLR